MSTHAAGPTTIYTGRTREQKNLFHTRRDGGKSNVFIRREDIVIETRVRTFERKIVNNFATPTAVSSLWSWHTDTHTRSRWSGRYVCVCSTRKKKKEGRPKQKRKFTEKRQDLDNLLIPAPFPFIFSSGFKIIYFGAIKYSCQVWAHSLQRCIAVSTNQQQSTFSFLQSQVRSTIRKVDEPILKAIAFKIYVCPSHHRLGKKCDELSRAPNRDQETYMYRSKRKK